MRGIDLHQADPQVDVITPVVEVTRPTAMDYHAERGFLYLADSHRHKILRQKLDLGEIEDFVTSGLNNVMGMAVDWDAIQCCREIHFSDLTLHNGVL